MASTVTLSISRICWPMIFKDAYRDKVCVSVFIGMCVYVVVCCADFVNLKSLLVHRLQRCL